MSEQILTEEVDGILTIKLNNVNKLNALTESMMDDLHKISLYVNTSNSVKTCIITGTDKFFSAGVDISQFDKMDKIKAASFLNETWASVATIKVPVIAAIEGYALGGGFELALMCDMIIASESAVFGLPEVNLGLLPGNGGTQRLPRLVGVKKAFEIIALGEKFSAKEALNLGIINKIVPAKTSYLEAISVANKIKEKSPFSMIAIKRALSESLNDGLKYERILFRKLLCTDESKNIVNRFLNK